MAEVQLIISSSGLFVDLYENESISQNWRFNDLNTFETTGAFSRQFRVPATQNNIAIFGAIDNPNTVPTVDGYRTKISSELRVSTLPISKGHLRVIQSYTQRGVISDFEISFYGETPDLTRALGDKKLSDIAALSTLNHVVNYDNTTGATGDYIYALIDRGQKWSEGGESGTRPVYNSDNPIYPADLTPAITWQWLFENILTEAGFEYDAADLLTILEGYRMPFCNSRWLKMLNPPESYYFNAYRATDLSSFTGGQVTGLTEAFDENSDFASSTYTSPLTAFYTFKGWMTIDPTPSTGAMYYMELRKAPYGLSDVIASAPPSFINAATASGSNVVNFQYNFDNLFIEAGTDVQMFIRSVISVTLKGSSVNNPNVGTGFSLIGMSAALYGDTIDFAKNAPDMLQVDFIKDVIKMHNLAVIPDRLIENKIKFINLYDYIGSGSSYDYTGKLDTNFDIVIKPTTDYQKKLLKFTYSKGEDVGSNLYQTAGRIYGDYKVDGYTISPDTPTNDFVQSDLVVDLKTQSTPANYIGGTGIVVPKFVNEQGEYVVNGPRCLFQCSPESVQVYDEDTDTVISTPVYLLNNFSEVNAQVDSYDLNFAPEVPLHEIDGNPYSNLFNLYWRSYLNTIYSPEARIMEASFALNTVDVLTFSFADKLFIKDSWWRIIEIQDYKIGMVESTRLTLMKIISLASDCDLTPVSNTGLTVNFIDGAGDPAAATQPCCERYGYSWWPDLSLCLNISTGGNRSVGHGFEQGTRGIGISTQQTAGNPLLIALASGLNTHPSNIQSFIAGTMITVSANNPRSVIAGDDVTIEGDLRGGLGVFGKSLRVNVPGIHLGGGWFSDDRSNPVGSVQSGTTMMSVKGGFTNNATELELLIEGVSGNRINLPVKVGWACVLTINLAKITAGKISDSAVSQHGFYLIKEIIAGVDTATAGTVHDIWKETSFVTPVITIDTATDPDEHRIKISTTGAGHPHTDCWVTAKLEYTQFRHD